MLLNLCRFAFGKINKLFLILGGVWYLTGCTLTAEVNSLLIPPVAVESESKKNNAPFSDPSQVARDRRAPLNERFLSKPYVAQPSRSPLALVTGKINRVF